MQIYSELCRKYLLYVMINREGITMMIITDTALNSFAEEFEKLSHNNLSFSDYVDLRVRKINISLYSKPSSRHGFIVFFKKFFVLRSKA